MSRLFRIMAAGRRNNVGFDRFFTLPASNCPPPWVDIPDRKLKSVVAMGFLFSVHRKRWKEKTIRPACMDPKDHGASNPITRLLSVKNKSFVISTDSWK